MIRATRLSIFQILKMKALVKLVEVEAVVVER
jgi:hypothetical protein